MGKKSFALGMGLSAIMNNHTNNLDETIQKDENGQTV